MYTVDGRARHSTPVGILYGDAYHDRPLGHGATWCPTLCRVCVATAHGKCGAPRCGGDHNQSIMPYNYQTTRGAEHGIEKTVSVIALAISKAVWK